MNFNQKGQNFMDITTNKKRNMAYWDEIDNTSETFVRDFANYAQTDIALDDDAITEIGKAVTEKVLEELKDRDIDITTAFPYVNENY